MPWISTISPEAATGRLAESYAWQSQRLGRPTEFTQLGSLEPELVHARLVLYKASENASSALTPLQRTLAGHVASAVNRTPHCTSRSRIKLLELGLTPEAVDAVEAGVYDGLGAADAAVARYADKLTRDPGAIAVGDIEALRAAGLGDHEIVDLNNQVAHLNYTNRVANGLGLLTEVEADFPAFDTVPA
ncbi:hypothetical protein [Solirubrobacter soli]|uniref:hypothetical protein n=1 Tax=Solirubrobacter soli TaxID=363832 RepID=UPI0003F94B40|nr:hypothetical protein [Solirubrobacter soli]